MVSKDRAIGGTIFIVCVMIGILYVVTLFYPQWLLLFGIGKTELTWIGEAQFWIIAVPVFIVFIAVMGIGAWIGWTMATTPPPKPIQDVEQEEQKITEETMQ